MTGKQSLLFDKDVYVRCAATVVGKKEADGPLGEMFDVAVEDDMFGKKSWEEAESHIQEMAVDKLLIKSGMAASDIDYIYAGDLLGQLIATSFGLMRYEIPMFGLYGACSTMGEALSLGAMCVNAGYAQNVIAIASSHFASAEKQFRYPLEYGNQRPVASTWTVTGAGAYIVGDKPLDKKKCVLIKGITTGKIVDYGVKDSMNMGACMAPAAAELIEANFKDLDVDKDYYDAIFTGDLGEIGNRILSELLKEKGIDIADKLYDCGMLIYEGETKCSGAVKGFEIGDGFGAAKVTGKYNNDEFVMKDGRVGKLTNHSGGVLGGISDGDELVFRAAVKPTPSISALQETVNKQGEDIEVSIKGRHDPMIVPRAVVVVEAMTALTLVDLIFDNMTARMDRVKEFYRK